MHVTPKRTRTREASRRNVELHAIVNSVGYLKLCCPYSKCVAGSLDGVQNVESSIAAAAAAAQPPPRRPRRLSDHGTFSSSSSSPNRSADDFFLLPQSYHQLKTNTRASVEAFEQSRTRVNTEQRFSICSSSPARPWSGSHAQSASPLRRQKTCRAIHRCALSSAPLGERVVFFSNWFYFRFNKLGLAANIYLFELQGLL